MSPETLARALDLQGRLWTQERIAKELGVHPVSLSRVLARHNRRRFDKLAVRHASIRAKQATQLEHMADEAYQGWERSKLDAETTKITTEGTSGEGDSDPLKTERTTKGQAGDTSFLGEARSLLAEVRKVLDMDKAVDPDKTKASDDAVLRAIEMIAAHNRAQSPPPAEAAP